jgi:hypothetical protein
MYIIKRSVPVESTEQEQATVGQNGFVISARRWQPSEEEAGPCLVLQSHKVVEKDVGHVFGACVAPNDEDIGSYLRSCVCEALEDLLTWFDAGCPLQGVKI